MSDKMREALAGTIWWGDPKNPSTWCWCDYPCDGKDYGCAAARAALAAPDEGRRDVLEALEQWCDDEAARFGTAGENAEGRTDKLRLQGMSMGLNYASRHLSDLRAAPASPEPRDGGLSDLRRDAVDLGDRLYSRMTLNERDFFNGRIRAASPEPEGERCPRPHHLLVSGEVCPDCKAPASPPSPAPAPAPSEHGGATKEET